MAARDPWLSIVMPVWNGERYLREALESIRQEGTGGYEVIAVDDGSSDRSPEILREWERHLPLRHVARERGGNWVAATNAGLREARGDYVCFLHQDDLWLPGRLAAIRQEARHAPALILHPAVFIAADGSRLGTWRCPLPAGEVEPPLFAERLIVQNFIAIPAPAFRREAALALGGMDEALWYLADWDLWLRLGSQGAIRYLTSALAAFRVHPSSQTIVPKHLADRRCQHQLVLERHAGGALFGGAEPGPAGGRERHHHLLAAAARGVDPAGTSWLGALSARFAHRRAHARAPASSGRAPQRRRGRMKSPRLFRQGGNRSSRSTGLSPSASLASWRSAAAVSNRTGAPVMNRSEIHPPRCARLGRRSHSLSARPPPSRRALPALRSKSARSAGGTWCTTSQITTRSNLPRLRSTKLARLPLRNVIPARSPRKSLPGTGRMSIPVISAWGKTRRSSSVASPSPQPTSRIRAASVHDRTARAKALTSKNASR